MRLEELVSKQIYTHIYNHYPSKLLRIISMHKSLFEDVFRTPYFEELVWTIRQASQQLHVGSV